MNDFLSLTNYIIKMEGIRQDYWGCYYAVETSPFYIAGGDVEFDPHHDSRRNHLCANPIVVKREIESNPDVEITELMNQKGYPIRVYAVDLNGFTGEKPELCITCPNYIKHPGFVLYQPELKPVVEELERMGIRPNRIC